MRSARRAARASSGARRSARATAATRLARGSAPVAAALLACAAPPATAFTPAVDYALHCQGCHLADGSATPGSVPALAGSVGPLARTPAGRAYLARVPGVAHAPLGDAELAALLTWVVGRFGDPGAADFAPYTAEEIGRLRRDPLVDVDAARRALVPR